MRLHSGIYVISGEWCLFINILYVPYHQLSGGWHNASAVGSGVAVIGGGLVCCPFVWSTHTPQSRVLQFNSLWLTFWTVAHLQIYAFFACELLQSRRKQRRYSCCWGTLCVHWFYACMHMGSLCVDCCLRCVWVCVLVARIQSSESIKVIYPCNMYRLQYVTTYTCI